MTEASAELTVGHEHGLHLRPAALLVRTAAGFGAEVRLANLSRATGRTASAKSLLEVTALGVDQGHRVRIVATGEDAAEAVAALRLLVESGFKAGP